MTNKLPDDWEEKPLFKYLELVSSSVQQFQGTKKYIDTGALETGRIRGGVDVDYATRPSRANMETKEGDVLFAKMKDTEKVFLISKEDVGHLYSTGFAILRIKDKTKLLPKYIYFWLRSNDFQRLKNKESIGATQKAIGESQLKKFQILVPPIKAQERIIALLEKAEQIKNWRKEADTLSKDYLKSVFVEMFGDPHDNPKKWAVDEIRKDIKEIKYGTGTPPVFSEKGHAFVRATNVKKGRIVDEGMLFIDDKEAAKIAKCKLKVGQMIIVRSGVNTGDTCVIPKKYEGAYAGYDLILELKNELINPVFLNELLNHPYYQFKLKQLSRRAGQPHLNSEQISTLKIIMPLKKLQDKYVAIIDKVNDLIQLQGKSSEDSLSLFDSMMQKAFKGELV